VVLPQPDGPITEMEFPLCRSKDISERTELP